MMLNVSASPHIRDKSTISQIMRDVFLSLVPALIPAYLVFGIRAIVVCLVSVASCVGFEALWNILIKRPQTIGDFSAAVTGILLAYNLPVSIPLWIVVVGAFLAIILSKQIFGGLGCNFSNPAITARVILLVSFPAQMTNFMLMAGDKLVSSATPLAQLRSGALSNPDYWNLFLGYKAGCIGEISCLFLLIGAVYLLLSGIIQVWIPLSFLGTTTLIMALAGKDPLVHLLSGGLILGAFFMATDYVTSPPTIPGKIIFGVGCGLLVAIMRLYSNSAEGVSYAILFMNILSPHIESWTKAVPIGQKPLREAAKAKKAAGGEVPAAATK